MLNEAMLLFMDGTAAAVLCRLVNQTTSGPDGVLLLLLQVASCRSCSQEGIWSALQAADLPLFFTLPGTQQGWYICPPTVLH